MGNQLFIKCFQSIVGCIPNKHGFTKGHPLLNLFDVLAIQVLQRVKS